MVRRGSTVRVRQRASRSRCNTAVSVSCALLVLASKVARVAPHGSPSEPLLRRGRGRESTTEPFVKTRLRHSCLLDHSIGGESTCCPLLRRTAAARIPPRQVDRFLPQGGCDLGATGWSSSYGELGCRVGCVSCADKSAVFLRQVEDDGGRGQGAELERDEHKIAAMDGKRTDQQAPHEPHRPSTTADTRRAMFAPEMNYLWHIGNHRNRDANDAENFKHRLSDPFAQNAPRRLHQSCRARRRWRSLRAIRPQPLASTQRPSRA
jgi:hypothetical protein